MEIGNVFRKYQLKSGMSELLEFNALSIRFRRNGQGWEIYPFNKHEEEPETGEFFQTGVSDSLFLVPALQSKPLVFKGKGLSVLPRARFNFYLKIPLVFQFYHSRKSDENLITEIASARLSDTWFGESQSGEPAYALGSEYELERENLNPEFYEAICPVSVINNSDKKMELERMIIRVENLTLYQKGDQLLTSLVKLDYKGKETISEASYVSSKAIHGERPQVLAKARNEGKMPIKVNFHFIKNIYKGS